MNLSLYNNVWCSNNRTIDSNGILPGFVKDSNELFLLCPSPANKLLRIISNTYIYVYNVVIYDIMWKLVFKQDYSSNNQPVDVSGLKPGLYFIRINGMIIVIL